MGTWTERTAMPTPRHDLQTVAVDGKIYAISGANDRTVDAVELYDVATDTWTQGPPIPTRRGWLGADLIGGAIYVAGGKTHRPPEERPAYGNDYHFTSRDCLEVLDLETQTWSIRAPMPAGPRAGLSVVACRGLLWAIGGNTMLHEDQRILDRVEVYDPDTDSWAVGPVLPRPVQGPSVASHGGLIYLTGGISDADDGKQFRDETYVLDPDVGRWEPLAPVPTGRESSGVTVLDGRIYVIGGKETGNIKCGHMEIYDIAVDRWIEETPMPVGRCWLDACAVGERLFAMGGAYHIKGGYAWLDDVYEFVP